jgi:selenocysteine-specific elongation factor
MYVVATAGHVDHGKSTLVRALTGMEPDRWAEERRRGMTIDLGYAWLTLPGTGGTPVGERLAFVDVPGHERFVPNMLAGLGPVPAVMFVVAADGGWMPQSAEHLAAVDALGVRHGLLVTTRADLADPGPATGAALAEIAKTSLGTVEAVVVSAVTGEGLDNLRAALARLVSALPRSGGREQAGGRGRAAGSGRPGNSAQVDASARDGAQGNAPDRQPVRLWIDRSFTITGAGTVVTGTLPAGTVRNGQELLLTPSAQPVRVRGLQALGEPADEVSGVARVALNLRGIPADLPARGMALIEPGRWTLTTELDVRITPRTADPRPKLPAELLLHIGSARTQARLRILGTADQRPTADREARDSRADGSLAPAAIYARLRLRDPLPLHVGDRVLLRDPGAAGLAIHGATVLDPAPPPLARRGAGAAAVRELAAWPDVPTSADLLRRHKLIRSADLTAAGVTGQPAPVAGDWLADRAHWSGLRAELAAVVAGFCARDPLAPGMPTEAARAALNLPSRDLVTALVTGDVVQDGGYLRIVAAQAAEAGPHSPAAEPPATRPASARPSSPGGPTAPVPAGAASPAPVRAASNTPAGATSAAPARATSAAPAGAVGTAPAASGGAAPAGAVTAAGRVPPTIAAAVQAVLDDLAQDPFAAPDSERLRSLGLDAKALATAARAGLLLRVAGTVVLAVGAGEEAARRLAELDQPFTTSQARQALGTSRRVAIPLLEYLDRARITERLPGDLRRIRNP